MIEKLYNVYIYLNLQKNWFLLRKKLFLFKKVSQKHNWLIIY